MLTGVVEGVACFQRAAKRVNTAARLLDIAGSREAADKDAQHRDLGVDTLELGGDGQRLPLVWGEFLRVEAGVAAAFGRLRMGLAQV